MITPRARVQQAMRHQQPDRVPWQFEFTVPARRKLQAYYGVEDLAPILLMVDMLEAPTWVDELLAAITAYDLGIIKEVVKYDIDAVMFGDDWGQQTGLLMGGRLWRRFLKPHLAQMYQAVKRAGKLIFIHSCGKVQELFPDLIELGLDCFNPFQPEVMNPYEIKRQFGQHLAFYGGMSIQRILPYGTPQEVRDEARRLMDEIGRSGGYIIAPSHAMPGDIPVENMVAFIETVRAG